MKSISLYFKSGSSDKEYHVQMKEAGDGYTVDFQYGRKGSTMTGGTKTPKPVNEASAEKIFNALVKEKMAKGYTEGASGVPYAGTEQASRKTGLFPQLLNPIESGDVERYLKDPEWGAQEKKDGKHIMLAITDSRVVASNRKGLSVAIPEPVKEAALKLRSAVIDGEAVGTEYYAFDCLSGSGQPIYNRGYHVRYDTLVKLLEGHNGAIHLVPLAVTEKDKTALFKQLRKDEKEGIVFKRLDAPYAAGRPNSGGDMLKFKFYSTCSCLVSANGRDGKRSVAISCVEGIGGSWKDIPVGNVTVPANQPIPKAGDVVELRYLYAYPGGSLYQPVLLGVRDDLDFEDCQLGQLKYKAEE
jgi:bifunctional non-homologous end joining protein LigD